MLRMMLAVGGAAGLALAAGCGANRGDQIKGSWICNVPNIPIDDTSNGSATLRVSYLSDSKTSGIADISGQAQGMTMSFNLTYQGDWKLAGNNLEETVTSLSANYGTINGMQFPAEALAEMTRLMLQQGSGFGGSMRIADLKPRSMTLEGPDGAMNCTR